MSEFIRIDQLITAALDLLKFTAVNDNASEYNYNSGWESENDNKIDISVKTVSDTIVKKKNEPNLKVVEWIIHKDCLRLFVLNNFEDEIYQDPTIPKPKLCRVNCDPRLKLGSPDIFQKRKTVHTHQSSAYLREQLEEWRFRKMNNYQYIKIMLPTMIMSDGVIKQIIIYISSIQDQKSLEKYIGSWTGCSMYAVEIIRMCQNVQPGQDGWLTTDRYRNCNSDNRRNIT
jgi:hypothetical protein